MGSLTSFARRNRSNTPERKEEKKRAPAQTLEQQADSMQMVLPNIYMGSAVAAKNLKLLKSMDITHVLAIGWNLIKHFPDDFEYLLLNRVEDRPGYLIVSKFTECFVFMDECLITNKSKVFVHCHKGLSRSATIIIGYEMYAHKKPFNEVLRSIREYRSFIMPNIGFQAQLMKFEQTNYSLDFDKDWATFDVLNEIHRIIPSIKDKIIEYYRMYQANDVHRIDHKDLFAKTMYIHQVHKLRERNKLSQNDIDVLNQSIKYLRRIQEEYIKDAASINRFNVMFKTKDEENVIHTKSKKLH
eukprot:162865_1